MPFQAPDLSPTSTLYSSRSPSTLFSITPPHLTLLSVSSVFALQISAYRAPAWIRCAIMGQCAWSRTTSRCASAPRPARKRPTQCADLTATATAVPARCERWVVPCRGPFTSSTKDPVVSNCAIKHHVATKQPQRHCKYAGTSFRDVLMLYTNPVLMLKNTYKDVILWNSILQFEINHQWKNNTNIASL